MCFHIGPEFVEALQPKRAANSSLDIHPKGSDDTHSGIGEKHLTRFNRISSRLRSISLTAVTIKWMLLVLWACF